MSIKYSYICDSIKFINDNEQRIKNLLLDYECHIKNDRHPSGIDVKTLIFSKKNVKIYFSPLRIDFDYSFASILDEDVNSYEEALAFFKLFGEIFPDYKAERIAIYLTRPIRRLRSWAGPAGTRSPSISRRRLLSVWPGRWRRMDSRTPGTCM